MHETVLLVERPLGSEWILYGQDFGAKTEDLRLFDDLCIPELQVLRGAGLGASYFREFLALNNFSRRTEDYKMSYDYVKIPDSLKAVAKEIPTMVPVGAPFIVRSSAIGEHGGTGIYDSDIVTRTGKTGEDLKRLARAIKLVYSSYNSDGAVQYRLKTHQPYDGMGLLVQPLYGDRYGETIQPVISGVMTPVNGSPTLRFVRGFGVSAVDMDEAVVLKRNQIQEANVRESLQLLRKGTSWDDQTQGFSISTSDEFLDCQQQTQVEAAIPKLNALTQVWRSLFDAGHPYYWEFSITETDDFPTILQAAPLTDISFSQELPPPIGEIFCEGTDVVGQGIKEGQGIIWIGRGGVAGFDLGLLNKWNRENTNYLLLISDRFFSQAGGPRIKLGDFSNAAGVVELQYVRKPTHGVLTIGTVDHTHQRGGAHFTQLCEQVDILFLGSEQYEFDQELEQRLGKPSQGAQESSSGIWDIPFRMINAAGSGRVELLGEVKRVTYEKRDLDNWAQEFRDVANMLVEGNEESVALANSCYELSYFLWDQAELPTMGFDPFDISRLSNADKKKILDTLPKAREGYVWTDEYANYLEAQKYGIDELPPVEQYMNELEELLRKSLSASKRKL